MLIPVVANRPDGLAGWENTTVYYDLAVVRSSRRTRHSIGVPAVREEE